MATREQIELLLTKLMEARPQELISVFNKTGSGVGAVLHLLRQRGQLTAGEISGALMVSTARVAVLLGKMESRRLIQKQKSDVDRRVTVVAITESGLQMVNELEGRIRDQLNMLIDEVGMERLTVFLETAKEIHDLIGCPVLLDAL